MKEILLYGLKSASATSTAIPLPINADDQLVVSGVGTGIARTTNPTAVSDGADVRASYDDVGRQLTWPFQVRDLAATASATLTNGTAATLLAGAASVFHDLVHVSFANQSTAAANVALIADGTTMKTVQVPASSTLSLDFTYPLLQGTANTVWTVDMEDITGTTVTIDATFIKNV